MGKGGQAVVTAATPASAVAPVVKYTWQQVQEHRTPDDAWVVYHNKVYNVSSWYEHPGGAVIFTHAGDDMTDIFAAFHAPGSQNLMKKFYIGDLDTTASSNNSSSFNNKTPQQVAFEKGYRDLRSKLVVMGMFKANKWFYLYKSLTNFALWSLAYLVMYTASDNNVAQHLVACTIMGLFLQQCGWLAHDFLHHQVFKNRRYGDYMGMVFGNLTQGFSIQWWKNKHNGHHAVPNLHNSTALSQDGDPDIDTMPLLAWSVKQAQSYRELRSDGKDSALVKFMMRHQALLYFPILLLARLSWLNESLKAAFGLGASSANAALEYKAKGLQYPFLEKFLLFVHYGWMTVFCTGFGRFSFFYSFFCMFIFTSAACGFFLAIVFGLGHNGMATYDANARPDFWKLQVTTTRNITGGHGFPQAFVDWFCGGLQYQVDHHLFPTLPRHNLAKTHALVKSFCKEWNVQYHEADLVDGNAEVLKHLSDVSNEFLIDFIKDGPTM